MIKKIQLLFGALAFLAAIYLFQKYRIAPDIHFDKLKLEDINGQEYTIDSFGDKHLFINFYASWCGPCIKEMPSLSRAADILKDDYVFLVMSGEDWSLTKRFLQHRGYKLLKMNMEREEIGVHTIPTSYVLSPDKEVLYNYIGEKEWDNEENIQMLKELLH